MAAKIHDDGTPHGLDGNTRGLESEEPADPSGEDATAWLMLYEGLIDFTERSLEDTRQFMDAIPEPGRRHLQRTNVRIMEEELENFRRRRDFWRARVGPERI
jgi:hypothetical protein